MDFFKLSVYEQDDIEKGRYKVENFNSCFILIEKTSALENICLKKGLNNSECIHYWSQGVYQDSVIYSRLEQDEWANSKKERAIALLTHFGNKTVIIVIEDLRNQKVMEIIIKVDFQARIFITNIPFIEGTFELRPSPDYQGRNFTPPNWEKVRVK